MNNNMACEGVLCVLAFSVLAFSVVPFPLDIKKDAAQSSSHAAAVVNELKESTMAHLVKELKEHVAKEQAARLRSSSKRGPQRTLTGMEDWPIITTRHAVKTLSDLKKLSDMDTEPASEDGTIRPVERVGVSWPKTPKPARWSYCGSGGVPEMKAKHGGRGNNQSGPSSFALAQFDLAAATSELAVAAPSLSVVV